MYFDLAVLVKEIDCFSSQRISLCFADETPTFVHPSDLPLFNKWDSAVWELQVANHELLGHGSGKLFKEDEQGKKNFDEGVSSLVMNPALWKCLCPDMRITDRTHRSSTH